MRISTSPKFPGHEEWMRLIAERGFDRMHQETQVLLNGKDQVPGGAVVAADEEAGIVVKINKPGEKKRPDEHYEYLRGEVEIVLPETEAA